MVEADRVQHDFQARGDPSGDRIFALLLPFRRDRVGGEQPQRDGDGHDDRARAAQKDPRALPQADQHVAHRWQLIARHFHHEPAAFAARRRLAQYQRGEHRADDAEQIQAEQHQPLQPDPRHDVARRNERADDDGIDRQPRRTGHQRGDQDRRQPFLGIVDRARRHDAGNGAGEGGEQRDERAARQADRRHHPVHQQRGADHIAGRLQHQDEEEQDDDLGQEHHHRSDAVDDAFDQQVAQEGGGQCPGLFGKPALGRLDPADRRLRPGIDRLEHDEQDGEQHQRPRHRVQDNAIDRAGEGAGHRLFDHRDRRQPPCLALEMRDFGVDRVGHRRPGAGEHVDQRRAQMIEAAFAHRHGFDHRHAQRRCQRGGIDPQAVARRHVDHVERQHHRAPELFELQHEAQMVFDVAGVGDHDQRVGQPFARLASQHDVARHLFVGAGRIEAVGAGQVDQFDRAPVVQHQPSRMPLDRDARIIADLLPRAGQRVEQRGLAGIGIADQCDER